MGSRAGHKDRRWRVSNKKAHIDTVRNDINVTPLVDVMLVLLILFMLMTLIMGRGHDVKVPNARNFSEEKDKMQPVISIDVNGELFVEKNRIGPINPSTLKEMEQQIKAVWADPKKPEADGRVYLKADDAADYGTIYPVLVHLNQDMFLQTVDLAVAKPPEGK